MTVNKTQTKPESGIPGYGLPLSLDPFLRMLLIGDTGAGKTSQIGLLAEYLKATENVTTILFTGDKGGLQPLKPYIDLGIIKAVVYDRSIDPWIWIAHAIRGEVKVDGKWVRDMGGRGLAAYEGVTAFAEMLLLNLSEHSANNPKQAVGGESAWIFEASDGAEKIAMASNTMSHYGLAQLRIMQEIWEADPGVPTIWTAILQRVSDPLGGGGVLAAQSVGKAQGASIPRWFDLTFRINAQPTESGPARHVLYLQTHLDKQAKGAKVIANVRLPLAGMEMGKVDATIEPADIVKALLQIRRRNEAAKEDISARVERIRKGEK